MTEPALAIEELHARYGPSHVLQGVSLAVPRGGTLALLGRNGAGKTTALRATMNLIAAREGRVRLFGRDLGRAAPAAIVRAGMTMVLEDRGVFPSVTVAECLSLAAPPRGAAWSVGRVLAMFPRVGERLGHRCGQLSGGEQQMLAIGRALLTGPRVLLLDEPTQGLAPIIVRELLDCLLALRREDIAIVLVEQNFEFARRLAEHAVVLGKGRVQWSGAMASLAADPATTRALLGV